MNRLPVDLRELAVLFDQPRRGPVRAFFDRSSGELESMPRDAEAEGLFDDIIAAPERWVEIHGLPNAERIELRHRFVENEVTDAHLRLRLFELLEGQRPFARFEAVLRETDDLLDRWFAFRASAFETIVLVWLSALGVAPRDVPSP